MKPTMHTRALLLRERFYDAHKQAYKSRMDAQKLRSQGLYAALVLRA